MERTINTKFYTYHQNNSGGSFHDSETDGIGEYVIIEALNASHANQRAEETGIYFDGCSTGNDCTCCGDRWYEVDELDGYDVPSIYGQSVDEFQESYFSDHCFIHYLDNTFKKVKFKDN